jgi:hypothetical protein
MRKPSLYFLPLALGAMVAAVDASQVASGSGKIWINSPRDFEKFLMNADIVSVKDVGSGVNEPKKITLAKEGLTLRAIWKPILRGRHEWAWESYQAEVAAYKLDRLLGLDMVPPTVVRDIGGEVGSLQLWVEGCKLYVDVQEEAPQTEHWERQLSEMKLFDQLISNKDRYPRNYMVDAKWNLVLIDHSQAFWSTKELESDPEKLPDRFDRKMVEKLKDMELQSLQFRLDRLLLDPQIETITVRRDALLDYLNKLIAEKGEDAVLY